MFSEKKGAVATAGQKNKEDRSVLLRSVHLHSSVAEVLLLSQEISVQQRSGRRLRSYEPDRVRLRQE